MIHKLKTLPTHFKNIKMGVKFFEIRDNYDRGFQKDDLIIFEEYDTGRIGIPYTGKTIMANISYVTNFNQPDNQVVFGFTLIEKEEDETISSQNR